ncbi:MAG: TIGR02281 family clan AA aspartic protease [Gammaproteobacteria bacterium]|nr:TIGR02281 family clan AA aspartic protease [Gammaproteobacteria bacterium]
MFFAAWLLLMGMLALMFDSVLQHQTNPNSDPEGRVSSHGSREVTLLRNRAGHYVATGIINGSRVTFLLDTGATDVAVSEQLATRLGLKRGRESRSRTANGTVRTWRTHLDEVGIGPIRLKDIRASILPSMNGNEVLLGMSFLKQLELVQRGDSLTLRQID